MKTKHCLRMAAFFTGIFFLIVFSAFSAEQPSENPLAKFAKTVEPDIFNPDVAPEQRKNVNPVPGGDLRIRMPSDVETLNPLTSDEAQVHIILGYIYDSLIARDHETFEWLPWMAQFWEVRDLVIMQDGRHLEGTIISEEDEKIVFAEGVGKVSLAKFECEKIDCKKGEVTTKWGATYNGNITSYHYTIEISEAPQKEPITLLKKDIGTYETEIGEKKIVRPAIKKNVVFIFHLRDGIAWHDGAPVTVGDITFGFETMMNKKVDCAPTRSVYTAVEDLKVIDEKTIKLTCKKPYFQSFSVCGGVPILPAHIYEPQKFKGDPDGFAEYFNNHEQNRKPLGNGAYTFKEWKKGEKIVLEKTPNYWANKVGFPYWKKGQPYLDRISWVIINNPLAAIKELENGNIDADFDIEPNIWLTEATNTKEFTANFVRANILVPLYTYIGWNQARPYFKDPLVRQALTHLIPRRRILNDIHRGLGEIITGPSFINGPIYDHAIAPYEYDPVRAKRLLRKAGWLDHDGDGIIDKDGVKFEFEYLIHNAREYHQKIADIVKESLAQAGIKTSVRKLDATIFFKTVSDRNFDAVRLAWGYGIGSIEDDPFQLWHSSQSEGRGSNYVGFSNKTADELIEKGREEMDPVKRWEMFGQLHQILHEEQPYTFMFSFETLLFYNKKFRNVKHYVVQPGYNLTEWYIPQEK